METLRVVEGIDSRAIFRMTFFDHVGPRPISGCARNQQELGSGNREIEVVLAGRLGVNPAMTIGAVVARG